ncbi:MAG: hypothetical protein HOP19_21525 [Acidobacteria bacterium]|nr:hypothetical protein [Acidobacteriota bacterium]
MKKASRPDGPTAATLDRERLINARRWLLALVADIETVLCLKSANDEQRASAARRIERLIEKKEANL